MCWAVVHLSSWIFSPLTMGLESTSTATDIIICFFSFALPFPSSVSTEVNTAAWVMKGNQTTG